MSNKESHKKKKKKKPIKRTLSNSKENSEISPGILEIATIAHIWIQKDSNFASLRGLDSYLNL